MHAGRTRLVLPPAGHCKDDGQLTVADTGRAPITPHTTPF